MSVFPQIQTPRLRLREIVAEDSPALFAIHGNPERMKWFGADPLPELAAAEKLVATWSGWRDLPNPGVRWGIEANEKAGLIGTCGLFAWNRNWRKCMLGYELAREVERQGYMREAITAILAWAWSEMSLNRIEAQVHPDNQGSIALVERLGFVFEGKLRQVGFWGGKHHDMLQYSLLKQEWAASAGTSAA